MRRKSTNRLSLAAAATILEVDPQTVRQGVITGTLKIGYAIPPRKNYSSWTFIIYRELVEKARQGELLGMSNAAIKEYMQEAMT